MSRKVHLVGIGGAGLSGIARILLDRGEIVTGSDLAVSEYSQALEQAGVRLWLGHHADNVVGADLVVASSAVSDANPEVMAARRAGIRVVRRNEFLGELTEGYQTVAVAGTHGKTTTTGMITWVLEKAGSSPTFLVGGLLEDFGTNARLGTGPHFVIEADEYDRAFLALRPSLAVVTSVEHDHPDCYPTFDHFRRAFESFASRVEGCLVVYGEDPVAGALLPGTGEVVRYGLGEGMDWRADEIRSNAAGGSDFLVVVGGQDRGLVRTRLPGRHNVLNALGALAAVDHLGVPFAEARQALTEFHGARRRFEVMGEAQGVIVIDDYAHHPSEIRATLAAARARYPEAQIWAVFQPHTFSRTRVLLEDFGAAFTDADQVIVTEIFASREHAEPGVSGRLVAERIPGKQASFLATLPEAVEYLAEHVRAPATVVILSAGDANQIGHGLLQTLRGKEG
jgi:UDP-N-acetylmuramate--alanine ligase